MVEILHGWSESQRKMDFFSGAGKETEAELERISILLKTCWLHTLLLRGCIKQDK